MGQDLAFTGGQTHVSGFAECEANEREDDSLTEVEGMDGTMLRTDIQMAYYKEWFERRIRMLQGEVEVINATEGGARIYGTREMTLADAIAQWCTKHADSGKDVCVGRRISGNRGYLFCERAFHQ